MPTVRMPSFESGRTWMTGYEQPGTRGAAINYLQGVFDTISAQVHGNLCLPETMSNGAALSEAAHLWFTNHPDWQGDTASVGIGLMIMTTFGCIKQGGGQ
jgi:hypothetical protein